MTTVHEAYINALLADATYALKIDASALQNHLNYPRYKLISMRSTEYLF